MASRRVKSIDCDVGNTVKLLRRAFSMTQSELAKQLEISPQQLHKYEVGIDRISATMIYKISDVFQCDISMFFFTEKKENGNGLLRVAEKATKFNYKMKKSNDEPIELLKIFFKLSLDKKDELLKMARSMASDAQTNDDESKKIDAKKL